jgi:hypothetical protein
MYKFSVSLHCPYDCIGRVMKSTIRSDTVYGHHEQNSNGINTEALVFGIGEMETDLVYH